MQLIETINEMSEVATAAVRRNKTIAFVPTMGFLHQGHLSLMAHARGLADILVASIFVNPTQFGPNEDLDRYPRAFESDSQKCRDQGVDYLFFPQPQEMYPDGWQTTVNVSRVTANLCGKNRPVHFTGVATVVLKLFNIIKPTLAVFGEKDYQQLVTIRRMVKDLNLKVDVVGQPTVREPDGLAMSSRNVHLSTEERRSALSLSASLARARDMVAAGARATAPIIADLTAFISHHPYTNPDYVSLVDPETLEDLNVIETRALLALAVKVGQTRLIDNCILSAV
ncbi:MAG: pantoate--beta-alanine ligase [Deltaproteobacteria bacterium]|nr:pantoate--beta-alanine ligase [Deltaproteobacteria bacterium]